MNVIWIPIFCISIVTVIKQAKLTLSNFNNKQKTNPKEN